MKFREVLAFLFIFGYGILMALVGYLGRGAFVSGGGMIMITLVAAVVAMAIFWAIWHLDIKLLDTEKEEIEKRKRDEVDSVLRELNSTDFQTVKRRLLSGEFDEGHVIDDEEEWFSRSSER